MNLESSFRYLDTVKRSFLIGLALIGAGSANADLVWNFQSADTRPGSVNGIYAYYYPNPLDSGSKKTPAHTATLWRDATGGTPKAVLDFVLDGEDYPSAGFGLMFPEAKPLDLREMKSVRLHLSSSKPRHVVVSLAVDIKEYRDASSKGISMGLDTLVGPEGLDLEIPKSQFLFPTWANDDEYPTSLEAAFAATFGIQVNVSCENKLDEGVCSNDSGRLILDSLRIVGVGGAWPTPANGIGCFGDSSEVSQFTATNPKKNGLGGWWYAFTDANAGDTASRGSSRILSAADTAKAGTWRPDSLGNRAFMRFRLERLASYSGFMGLETQFGPTDDSGRTKPYSLPDLASVGFDVEYGDFPAELGGISFHVKKAGRHFKGGQEHQIRLPHDAKPKRWCIDLSKLEQPSWVKPQLQFEPESLLTMSWEAKLQGVESSAAGEFSIRNVRIYRNNGVGVRPVVRGVRFFAKRETRGVLIERLDARTSAVATLVDARGKVLGRLELAEGARQGRILSTFSGLGWIQVRDAHGSQVVPVGL